MDQLLWVAGCQVRRAVSARLGSPELEFLNRFWICGCAAPALAKRVPEKSGSPPPISETFGFLFWFGV